MLNIMSFHPPMLSVNVNGGYLFKEGKVFIPQSSHRNLLIQETHERGLRAILGWKDIQRHCYRCISCLQSNPRIIPHGLYTP